MQGDIRPLQNPWGTDLWLLRSPVTDAHLGGNKYFKLTGYLAYARRQNFTRLITMAGAHSNHLRAFAAMAQRGGYDATALIRGDELEDTARHSAEIRFALAQGTQCIFVSRKIYRQLRETGDDAGRAALLPGVSFAGAVFIPEGGEGHLGMEGVREWARAASRFENVYLPVATGTTAAGFLRATNSATKVTGVAVLRNTAQVQRVIRLLAPEAIQRFELNTAYRGKFSKPSHGLQLAAAEFSALWGITIDATYMVRAVLALQRDALAGRLHGPALLVYTYNE